MKRKIGLIISLMFTSFLYSYTLGQKKSQYFLRWGITLADYTDTIIARNIDFVQYEENGSLKNLNFVVWTPYDKIPVKKFFINKLSGNFPQKKYGWAIVEGYGVYQTSSTDNTDGLAFLKVSDVDAVDLGIAYKTQGPYYLPQFVFTANSDGTFSKGGTIYKAFKDAINDTLPEGTDIDTLINNPLHVFSISLIPGQIDTFVYVGTEEGVFVGKLTEVYYQNPDTVYKYGDFYLNWTKIGNLTDTVTELYVTNTYILAATKNGLMRWDGSSWTNVNPNIVNSIKVSGTTIYIGTKNGAFYSNDDGNTWTSILGFSGKNVLAVIDNPGYTGLGNYFAVVENDGVYDENGNQLTSGLEVFTNFGALNGYDIEKDNYGRVWYACEAGIFYLRDAGGGNYVWNFNPGIEEKYDPQSPSGSRMIGVNVADELVNSFVSSFKNLFVDSNYIDIEEIKKMFNSYFGNTYPEDTIHFVITPYFITPPNPNGSPPYVPYDIYPVGLFTMYDKSGDTLQDLKDAIYVKVGFDPLGSVGGWLSFADSAKKMIFDYQFVQRGLFNLKPDEDKLVRTGFALLLTANYKAKTDSILHGTTEITGIPGLFDLAEYYDSTGTNIDMFNISKYHGWGEPEPNEFSKARVFTLFEYIKERYGLTKIQELFNDPSTTWERFYPYITGWALTNAIDSVFKNDSSHNFYRFDAFPPEEATTDQRYNFIEQEPLSYIIYTHNPDVDTHTLNFSFPDEASYFDSLGNWVSLIQVWVINYKKDTTIEIKQVFPVDTSRNVYSITLFDTTVFTKQKIVVINTDPSNTYSTARGRDTKSPNPILMVFQNPALDNFVDIYVWNNNKIYKDVNDEGVILTIKEGDNVIDIDENLTSLAGETNKALFFTSKELPRKKTVYTMTAFVEDTVGNGTEVVLSVPVYYVGTGGGVFSSSDGSVKVSVPSGIRPFMLTISKVDKEAVNDIIPGAKEGASGVFSIGSNGKKLSKTFKIEVNDPSLKKEGVSLYRYDSDLGWIPVQGIIDRSSGKFIFETDRFGIFQVRSGGFGINVPVLKVSSIMRKGDDRIIFYVPVRTNVELSLYNSSGRRISELLRGTKNPGIYEVNINVPVQGVYFIVADIDGFSKIKKKVIVLEGK